MNKAEALKKIQQTAEMILTKSQAPAVWVRLLRDILHRPHDDPELLEAREQLEKIEWVKLLTDGLWNFGSACANPYFTTRIRLSDGWQGKRGAYDWTTRILLLLQKYYEGSQ
jgi:hypothetical protein